MNESSELYLRLKEAYQSNAKYIITCPKCGEKSYYSKMSSVPEAYYSGRKIICGECGFAYNKFTKLEKGVIDKFDGEYFFLSNFFTSKFTYEGIEYISVESAFQAAKTLDFNLRRQISAMNPSMSKKTGRHLELRSDWKDVKDSIMKELVLLKFINNPLLKEKLVRTNDSELVEGNTWNDKYWGVCNGEGENHLGKILMEVRTMLK